MEKKVSNTTPQYLDSINQRLEKAKAMAKSEANKKREELEQELLNQAKVEHENAIKKWNEVLSLLHSTGAIDAPLESIKKKLEQLGKKYRKDSGEVGLKNSAANKPKSKEQGTFDLGNQETYDE